MSTVSTTPEVHTIDCHCKVDNSHQLVFIFYLRLEKPHLELFKSSSVTDKREETMLPWFFLLPLLSLFTCTLLGNGQTQTGFISIDCGIAEEFPYQDDGTGIYYLSDSQFINTGVNFDIPSDSLINRRVYKNVRSFPNGTRNCYTLRPVTKSNKYLIRAYFFYGNYDGKNQPPQFDLYIGVTLWITFMVTYDEKFEEIITVAAEDYISVCLVNSGFGVPFISGLELRPLKSSMYIAANESQFLRLWRRRDLGSDVETRYPKDPYDFLWTTFNLPNSVPFSTTSQVTNKYTGFEPPLTVMMNAIRPVNGSDTLLYTWLKDNRSLQFSTWQFHIYLHFAELEALKANVTREFNVCCAGYCHGHFRPEYLVSSTLSIIKPLSGKDEYTCSFLKTENSTLPPILNAIETYTILQFSSAATNNQDANAIAEMRDAYHVRKNWMGDPCLPNIYTWEGLICSYVDPRAPRITSLNLSSNGLSGGISYSLANLTLIQSIDLSGNNLTGTIPEFLGRLPSLKLLNLTGNNIIGTLPPLLLERFKNGSLTLSVDGNPNLCLSHSCSGNSNKKKAVIAILVAVAFAVTLLTALIILWIWQRRKRDLIVKRRNKKGHLDSENRQFTYSDVLRMTNNFQRSIGKGGFGTVYHGQLEDGTQVAVKMLSLQLVKSFTHSHQGSNEFQNEAHLLMRIHHKNLVPFVGYCNDENNMALIFTYMPEGNLGKHLSECSNEKILYWNNRLRIALDVAQGLEYLHHFCSPPIIHRDVKTANILLNENLEAKIADFGLSKSFVGEDMTHMLTAVKGTHGYLDPEYCKSNKLTEKSDVYGFGVVLLQLVTGQPAIIRRSELDPINIIEWVSPLVAEGDMRRLVDPRMKEDYDINVVSKAIEIAISCTLPRSSGRPTMSKVVAELKECLGIEDEIQRTNSMGVEDTIQRTSRLRREEEDIGSISSPYPLPR